MAIATYSELKTAITDWAERSDLSDALLDQFIFMTEADAFQMLRVPAMEDQEELEVVDGRVIIPFDFLELRRLTWEGAAATTLQYLPWDQFVQVDQSDSLTEPVYFSRQGANWFLSGFPADGATILCHYYRYMPALSTETPETWLLTVSPQTYLFGCLRYLYECVMDNERAAYWEAKFQRELTKLQAVADLSEYRGTALAVRSFKE